MKKLSQLTRLCVTCLSAIILSACTGGGGTGAAPKVGGAPQARTLTLGSANQTATPITISDTATIPQIDDTIIDTHVYVYNNSNKAIENIKYTVRNNNQALSFQLDASSIRRCAQILSTSKCELDFTSYLPQNVTSGNVTLEVNYAIDKEIKTFSRRINLARVTKPTSNLAIINSDVVINGYGNTMGHAMVYAYNTSSAITTDKPGVKISEAGGGSVRALELSSPILTASFKAGLFLKETAAPELNTTTNTTNNTNQTNTTNALAANSSVYVASNNSQATQQRDASQQDAASGGALISITDLSGNAASKRHKLSIIGNGHDTKTRTLLISNNGDVAANLAHAIEDSGHHVTIDTNSTKDGAKGCGSILAAKSSCEISLKLSQITTQSKLSGASLSCIFHEIIYF